MWLVKLSSCCLNALEAYLSMHQGKHCTMETVAQLSAGPQATSGR